MPRSKNPTNELEARLLAALDDILRELSERDAEHARLLDELTRRCEDLSNQCSDFAEQLETLVQQSSAIDSAWDALLRG